MASFTGTLGAALVNSALPEKYRLSKKATARDLTATLVELAQNDPSSFVDVIPRIKKLGDEFATFEGISVGLDDIEPEYAKRDPVLRVARQEIRKATTAGDVTKALLKAQAAMKPLSLSHKGDLGMQARSGSRGNAVQLMKTISTPVVVGGTDGGAIPYLIERGYAEGLSPAEQWIAGAESRSQVISGQLGTAIPGEMGKILASTMSSQVVSSEDCGTSNGIMVSSKSVDAIGRYLAGTGTLVTAATLRTLGRGKASLKVRSPLTCELDQGVCQRCMGTEVSGHLSAIGSNVGIRSAQALSEPLTQMQLSAKHGISLVAGDIDRPSGVGAVRELLEVPESFFQRAVVAGETGSVSAISRAPQGGHEVTVNRTMHYVPPGRTLKVSQGSSVEAGDILSSGIPSPADIVRHKGLGAGRAYLVDALSGVYRDSGKEIDRRHLELLAKSQLGYVRVVDKLPGYLPGEVIPYASALAAFRSSGDTTPTTKSLGLTLTQPALHHLPGTLINKSMQAELQASGVTSLQTTASPPVVQAHMAAASRTPLLNPNWMARLGHRYQKKTILDAAAYGETADLHSYDPVPGLVFGKEFGRGPKGTY